ncbi:MAG: hypothetical protein H6713_14430 [Myxococcales bacterium]|nr:hypothetical protein [Myxococcales bacterium]
MKSTFVVVLGSLLALPLSANAAGESAQLFGRPVTTVAPLTAAEEAQRRADFEAMLERNDWVMVGDQVLPRESVYGLAGAQEPSDAPAAWDEAPHRATIFLNFNGASLSSGNNAALNKSPCVDAPIDYPGFTGTEQQALALINVFETKMEPYGVRLAYEKRPPAHLPYAMVMMGGTPQLLGMQQGVLGVSCSNDCGDQYWRDLTFAFTGALNGNNTETLGNIALHEAAHAFGLAHIAGPEHMMYPFANPGNKEWASGCTAYDDSTGGINCNYTHEQFCGDGAEQQNSVAELMAYFGTNSVDTVPPTVNILEPADGLELSAGSSVQVKVDVSDDHEGFGWKLVLPNHDIELVAYDFETTWDLNKLPAGEYIIRVEAIDHERNESFDEVTIYVGEDAPATTGDDSGTTGDDSGTTGDDSSATTGPDEPTTAGPGDDDDDDDDDSGVGTDAGTESGDAACLEGDECDKGCGCSSPGRGEWPSGAWALALLILAARPRRRARA